ncbi:unnamed protein product [Trichobilharzia regenti]|nr:unnamed protein product [Trichobilharzia regenti]
MGLNLRVMDSVRMKLTISEIDDLLHSFRKLDHDTKGYISLNDLRKFCTESGEQISEEILQSTLNTMDLNKNGQVDMAEFLHQKSKTVIRISLTVKCLRRSSQLSGSLREREREILIKVDAITKEGCNPTLADTDAKRYGAKCLTLTSS